MTWSRGAFSLFGLDDRQPTREKSWLLVPSQRFRPHSWTRGNDSTLLLLPQITQKISSVRAVYSPSTHTGVVDREQSRTNVSRSLESGFDRRNILTICRRRRTFGRVTDSNKQRNQQNIRCVSKNLRTPRFHISFRKHSLDRPLSWYSIRGFLQSNFCSFSAWIFVEMGYVSQPTKIHAIMLPSNQRFSLF